MIRRRYLVRGRVQGVGYRAFVVRQAAALALVGWVRNRLDGRVELLAEASAEAHVALAGALEAGPRWARVDAVEVLDEEPGGAPLVGFQVRPTA